MQTNIGVHFCKNTQSLEAVDRGAFSRALFRFQLWWHSLRAALQVGQPLL